jgi:2-dehydro-3-deoxygalactonokinase
MSGEINSLLRASSLVSKLIPVQSNSNPEAFMRGVRVAWNRHIDGGILRRIFSARSFVLFAQLPPADISDYLSGLIIGAEIQEALDLYGSGSGSIILIGPPALCDAYSLALNEAGRTSTRVDNAASQGFEALFRAQLAHD